VVSEHCAVSQAAALLLQTRNRHKRDTYMI
jgi:hypothetical protein